MPNMHLPPPEPLNDPPRLESFVHPKVQFDSTDASFGGVVKALLAFAIIFSLAAVVGGVLLHWRRTAAALANVAPQYSVPSDNLPAEPRLEPIDRAEGITSSDVFVRQRAFETALHSYGRTNDPQYVHIPIDQAIKLVTKNLPVREQPANSKTPPMYGLLDDGESNSGRLYSAAPSWLGQSR
ncbi:MAG: hypothetical protein U0805_05320 [Pirellulales bacterium]